MQHHYGVDKKTILVALRILSVQPGFEFSEIARGILEEEGLEHAHPGFVDRLICGESAECGLGILSCEKTFRRMPNAEVIP